MLLATVNWRWLRTKLKFSKGMVAARLLIKGRVQGVFYRQTTKELARALSLTGWVRNLDDGRVEAYVQGDRSVLEQLIEWAKQGPPNARVDSVEVEWQDQPPEMHLRFEVR